MIEPLLLNLASHDVVSENEIALLRSVMATEKHFAAGEDIVVEGSRPPHSTVMIDGFSARYKLLADGTRQITALHIAGDFVDLHAFPLRKMDHGIVAMSPCTVVLVEHGDLTRITEQAAHLTRLLWLETLIDGAIHREWIVALGRRSKKSHLAHLICELFVRLQVVGRTNDNSFHFPLSQAAMADVLGLSVVHLNKTLQILRKEELVIWKSKTITIVDWARLQDIAEFDPTYLSLSVEPR